MNFKQWIKQAYGVDSNDHNARFTVYNMEVAYESGKRIIITDYEEEIQYRLDMIARLHDLIEKKNEELKALKKQRLFGGNLF